MSGLLNAHRFSLMLAVLGLGSGTGSPGTTRLFLFHGWSPEIFKEALLLPLQVSLIL